MWVTSEGKALGKILGTPEISQDGRGAAMSSELLLSLFLLAPVLSRHISSFMQDSFTERGSVLSHKGNL